MGDETMIIINKKKYDKALIKVSCGEYSVTQDGKNRKGIAPIIKIKLDDIVLVLETNCDNKWLEELKINDKKDISKYISDISYEDEKGWVSLITGNYKCFINKVENNKYELEFNCEAEECNEYYKIILKEKVEMIF